MKNLPEPVQYAILSFGIATLMIMTFFIHSLWVNLLGAALSVVLCYRLYKNR
jgi:hypothetical protein